MRCGNEITRNTLYLCYKYFQIYLQLSVPTIKCKLCTLPAKKNIMNIKLAVVTNKHKPHKQHYKTEP